MPTDLIARLEQLAAAQERCNTNGGPVPFDVSLLRKAAAALTAQGETALHQRLRDHADGVAAVAELVCRCEQPTPGHVRCEECGGRIAQGETAPAAVDSWTANKLRDLLHEAQGAIVDSRLAYPKEGAIAVALNAINAALILTHQESAAASPVPAAVDAAARAHFRAGFLAMSAPDKAGGWLFTDRDNMAADREPEAWDAYRAAAAASPVPAAKGSEAWARYASRGVRTVRP